MTVMTTAKLKKVWKNLMPASCSIFWRALKKEKSTPKKPLLKTKKVRIHKACLVSIPLVIKKEPIKAAIKMKSDRITCKPKISLKFFSFSLLRENSLVAISEIPILEKMDTTKANEKAKVNFPYSLAPKVLAI